MADKTAFDVVERWQTVVAVLLVAALAGGIGAAVLGNAGVPYGGPVGFVLFGVGCLAALAYLAFLQ
jgi:hypothetical protein